MCANSFVLGFVTRNHIYNYVGHEMNNILCTLFVYMYMVLPNTIHSIVPVCAQESHKLMGRYKCLILDVNTMYMLL